jgi:hypothetical protein
MNYGFNLRDIYNILKFNKNIVQLKIHCNLASFVRTPLIVYAYM